MQQQSKITYHYNGKEVDQESFNSVSKDLFKWFEGSKVNSVDFSTVSDFLDGGFKSEKQINNHLKDVLELGHIKKCAPQCFCEGSCKKPQENSLHNSTRHKSQNGETHKESQTIEAYKEIEGKLFYELDFNFIKQMAERMQSNKDNTKYELWNWKKPMTYKGIEDLKQATLRHLLEVLEGKYEDDGRKFGHLEAISNNVMMINYQLKNEQ